MSHSSAVEALDVGSDRLESVEGLEGWLFAKPALDLLTPRQPVDSTVEAAWREELNHRAATLQQRGIQYIHLGVPDKLSIMKEYGASACAPGTVGDQEPGFARWSSESLKSLSCLVEPTDYLTRQKGKYPLYWKSDTRWAPWSCYMAYQLLCSKLKVDTNTQLLGYPFDEAAQLMNLDQGQLPEEPQLIRTYRLRLRSVQRYANELALFREASSASEALLSQAEYSEGAQTVFENRHPEASRLCVVLIGDAHSGDSRTLFTGMLAETFAELHFIWGDAIDWNYIDQVHPDVVITQCSEWQMAVPPTLEFNTITRAEASLARLRTLLPDTAQSSHDCVSSARNQPVQAGLGIANTGLQTQSGLSESRVILKPETYALDPPGLVQEHGQCAHPETQMHTNAVSLTQVSQALVYFTGVSWWVHDGAREEVLRHGMPADQKAFRRWRAPPRLVGTTLMFATSAGAHCYYHWMLEILPKLGMLEREGISLDSIDHFLVREITGDWQLQTLARFGIDSSRIVETVKQPHWCCDKLLHIDLNCGINLKMHRYIPQWMKHLYPVVDHAEPRIKLYITRPEGVRRGIRNEEQILPLLRAAGFTILAMEGLSVAEQARLLSRVDVLMSPHGGALTNMVFCRPGITVVELFSRHVFPYYYGLAANCGHHYHAILENPLQDYARLVNIDVAQSFADSQHETAGLSFDVDVDAVAAVLSQV